MKYTSIKGQAAKSFKIGSLDLGIDCENLADSIADGNISACRNMWYKNSRLQTRPGFLSKAENGIITQLGGYNGELEYRVTDTVVYRDGLYHRLATANITADDYAHYTHVYLVNLYGRIIPVGTFTFLRYASDVFYLPESINFFTGKPQQGGGVFAMVTLCNIYNASQKNHYIYEVNEDFTEWERVNDYYVPTALINGRGNNYQLAKTQTGFSASAPIALESQNMLDNRFYSYYTADGFSSSFKLPYSDISNNEVKIRVYHSLDEYVEWVIGADKLRDTKTFCEKEIIAYIDRPTGTIYFKDGPAFFPIPVFEMCGENNIKVTATKDIGNSFSKITNAACVVRHNSKLLVAGGEGFGTIYVADYDNPLYFPSNSLLKVGESSGEITYMTSQQGKVLAFKQNETHLIALKEGEIINKIPLLSDNDKLFKKADTLSCEQLSQSVGCSNNQTICVCDGRTFWVSADNKIYTLETFGKGVRQVCNCGLTINESNHFDLRALGGGGYYYLIIGHRIAVIDIANIDRVKIFHWQVPFNLKIKGGFYFKGEYWFLCTTNGSRLSFMSTLSGKSDSILSLEADDQIVCEQKPIESGFATKRYRLSDKFEKKNIEGIYLNMAADGRVDIDVNECYKTTINFGFLNEDYNNYGHKSVRLSPRLKNVADVILTLKSQEYMSVGEIEIKYRVAI